MSNTTEKPVNYTDEMVAKIKAAAPLNLESAKILGRELGRTYRSVIAKAKSEGVEYISKPAPVKKPKAETKAEIVSEIEALTAVNYPGLEKSPLGTLNALRTSFRRMIEAADESDA